LPILHNFISHTHIVHTKIYLIFYNFLFLPFFSNPHSFFCILKNLHHHRRRLLVLLNWNHHTTIKHSNTLGRNFSFLYFYNFSFSLSLFLWLCVSLSLCFSLCISESAKCRLHRNWIFKEGYINIKYTYKFKCVWKSHNYTWCN
jgi:hypothetical protein